MTSVFDEKFLKGTFTTRLGDTLRVYINTDGNGYRALIGKYNNELSELPSKSMIYDLDHIYVEQNGSTCTLKDIGMVSTQFEFTTPEEACRFAYCFFAV